MSEIGIREAARIIGVHENTIRNWVKSGAIQVTRCTPGGHKRIDPDEAYRVRELITRIGAPLVPPSLDRLAHLAADWDAQAAQLERSSGTGRVEGQAEAMRDCAGQLRDLVRVMKQTSRTQQEAQGDNP